MIPLENKFQVRSEIIMQKPSRDTVGVFLKPHTRDRLNKFVADYRLATGRFMSQSTAIDLLLDHYAATQPVEPEREYA
jgi:uncharacterized protein YciW